MDWERGPLDPPWHLILNHSWRCYSSSKQCAFPILISHSDEQPLPACLARCFGTAHSRHRHIPDTARKLTCRHLLSAGLLLAMSTNSSPAKKGGEEYGYHQAINTQSAPPPRLPSGSCSLHMRKQPNVMCARPRSPVTSTPRRKTERPLGLKCTKHSLDFNIILFAVTVNNNYQQNHPVQTRGTVRFCLPLMWVLPGCGAGGSEVMKRKLETIQAPFWCSNPVAEFFKGG